MGAVLDNVVARALSGASPDYFADLRRQIRRWADDHLEEMRTADPPMPSALHDRAADNWRPLLAIATLAGGAWPNLADQAAVTMAGRDRDDDSIAEQLLADLHTVFHDKATVFDRSQRDLLSTARVTELLVALDSRPWATYNTKTGKPVSQYQVARLLKRFGVRPIKAKIDSKATNCYDRTDLEPAWKRYSRPAQVGTPEPVNDSGRGSDVPTRGPVEFMTLKGGLTVPLPALHLAIDLEARGILLATDANHQFIVPADGRLMLADLEAIRRWQMHLGAIVEYRAPEA